MMEKCNTCMHGYPNVACANCGTGFRNYLPYTPPTNADRIRSVNDEELANAISAALGKMSYGCYRCPAEDFCHSGECEQAWLDWLQQPAKEE